MLVVDGGYLTNWPQNGCIKPAEARMTETLGQISTRLARERGQRTAYVFRGRETSYADVERHANQVADQLTAAGCAPGARIAQIGKNSDVYYELLLGCAKAGCALVPINWRLAPPEIRFILADSGAEILFVGAEFVDVAAELLDRLSKIRTVIAIAGGHAE